MKEAKGIPKQVHPLNITHWLQAGLPVIVIKRGLGVNRMITVHRRATQETLADIMKQLKRTIYSL